ncbi:MAG: thiamine pyrophosphate-dependent enzyme, partial [Thermoanaerobaculia bacterium]
PDSRYTLQVYVEDCTGCGVCVENCPAHSPDDPKIKAINMKPRLEHLDAEVASIAFFEKLPWADRTRINFANVRGVQFMQPLFEFSGACAGCGETPYLKLLSQLFGDRLQIANATGCSSIYGGNLPTTPWAPGPDGRGPAWANSLFEDNAEFGLGFRLAVDARRDAAERLLRGMSTLVGEVLVEALLHAEQTTEGQIAEQRARVAELKKRLAPIELEVARRLERDADSLVKKSVWVFGGDGWAYDIGYGGLDHVLSLGRNVNVLVLDTEVYSNTGGQQSKATPIGAAAKFATAGKTTAKKDLGMMAMAYGNVYVARIAFGAGNKDVQTVKALQEAESFDGASLVIAYSPCIAHGYDMAQQLEQQQLAVQTGYWPLYRFDPRKTANGESPLTLDSGAVKGSVGDFMRNEARFRVVEQRDPERFKTLVSSAQATAADRLQMYDRLAKRAVDPSAPSLHLPSLQNPAPAPGE